jgi:hypothetical protein
MPTPNYELLAAPAVWDDDVLCGLDLGPPPPPPPFDPTTYAFFRWSGVLTKQNIFGGGTPFIVSDVQTSQWRSTSFAPGVPNYGRIWFNTIYGTAGFAPAWRANHSVCNPVDTGSSGNNVGFVTDASDGILYMLDFGAFSGNYANNVLLAKTTNGRWQFTNDTSPNSRPQDYVFPDLFEWTGEAPNTLLCDGSSPYTS